MWDQEATSASTANPSGTASFRSRWQAMVEAQNRAAAQADDAKETASGKQSSRQRDSSGSAHGTRSRDANAGGSSIADASGSAPQQTQQEIARMALLADGQTFAEDDGHMMVAAKLVGSNDEEGLAGTDKSPSRRGKLESVATRETDTSIMQGSNHANLAIAIPVQADAALLASSLNGGADRMESAASGEAQAHLSLTVTAESLASSDPMHPTPGFGVSTESTSCSDLTAPGVQNPVGNTQPQVDFPISGSENLPPDGAAFSSPIADAWPVRGATLAPQADSATVAHGEAVLESSLHPALPLKTIHDGDNELVTDAVAASPTAHEAIPSSDFKAVSNPQAHPMSTDNAADTVTPKTADGPASVAAPLVQAMTGDSPAAANSTNPTAVAGSSRVHAAPAATASALVNDAPAAVQSQVLENSPNDVSSIGAIPAEPIAIEAKLLPNAKTNALRSGRSLSATHERIVDRTAEPAPYRAGGLVFDAASSIHQSERGQHAELNPMLMHDTAGMTLNNGGRHSAEVSAASNGGFSGRDTFAALDAETVSSPTTWIQAGARRAEAGYQDPALGWVGVRAQTGGGGVHAAVVPGSPEAAQALNSHLNGLNAFMAEHHGHGSTVMMAAPETSQGMQFGSGQHQENPGREESSSTQPGSQASTTSEGRAPVLSMPADTASQIDGITAKISARGVHISVVA
jgi:hypothetical protein